MRAPVALASIAAAVILAGGVVPSSPPIPAGAPARRAVRLIAEAEDFTIERGGWRVVPYGQNYFASTFAVTFLSRMAALGAPEQVPAGQEAVAVQAIDVAQEGELQVLARFEQPWGFSVEFTLEIEQAGRVAYRHLFGRLEDPKIWAFNEHRRVPMERYSWGGTDNIVWQEGGPVRLARGPARLRLLAGPQLEGGRPRAQAAERHVDVVCLTNDLAGLEAQRKTSYLELDGWLVQAGDLFARFTNPTEATAAVVPVVEPFAGGQHSPYAVHIRDWPTTRVLRSGRLTTPTGYEWAGPRVHAVRASLLAPILDPSTAASLPDDEYLKPGETSGWVPMGDVLDAMNESEWLPKALYKDRGRRDLDLGIELAVPDGKGGLRPIRKLRVQGTPAPISVATLVVPGNVTARPQIETQLEALQRLRAELARGGPAGSAPKRFPIYGLMDFSAVLSDAGPIGEEATRLALELGDDTLTPSRGLWAARLGVPARRTAIATHWPVAQVESAYAKAVAAGLAPSLRIVSFGDEIRIPPVSPAKGDVAGFAQSFAAWLRGQGVEAPSPPRFTSDPADPWYYYSTLYARDLGLEAYVGATQWLRSRMGPELLTGINYAPHPHFLVTDLEWVRPFRRGALTMPWSEDYVWQVPEFSVQATGYLVTAMRAGAREPRRPILMYVMPHSPGNTPRDFRLSFYTAVGHGAGLIHYFCATPSAVGQTENYVDGHDLPMWRAIREVTHDAARFEDYVVDASVRPARVGLLLSSVDEILTGQLAGKGGLHNEERKAIYYALRHAQVPVDMVTEGDVIEGRIAPLQLLYVTQEFLSSRAVGALRRWVEAGGTLVALGGGGFRDELGRANPETAALYGVKEQSLTRDPALETLLPKQDLPRARALGQAGWGSGAAAVHGVPVIGWKQTLTPATGTTVLGTFEGETAGGSAVVERGHGRGRAILFGFLPGLAYLKSGLPLRPVDRGATDASFAHFLPRSMDEGLRHGLVDAFLPTGFERPVECSERLVESTILDTTKAGGKGRAAVALLNYSGAPYAKVVVRVAGLAGAARVSSVRQGSLTASAAGGDLQVTLPLEVADLLLIDR